MTEESGANRTLEEVRFEDLFRMQRLPSGHEFELMPDTVENALKVSEADDMLIWRKKARQAVAVTESIGGNPLHGDDAKDALTTIQGMLDTDVLFLSMAWTAQMNGMSLKLAEGVPCPSCAHPFMKVPFGDIVIHCRTEPVSMPVPIPLDIDKDLLPESLKSGELFLMDPNWKSARQNVAEKSWSNPDVVNMHRAMACLHHKSPQAKMPRRLHFGEAKKMSFRALSQAMQVMDDFVPHLAMSLDLTCENCGAVSVIPFDQGL